MKKLILIVLLILLIVGCSDIPRQERVHFCEEKGLDYHQANIDGWMCKIDDIEYIKIKCNSTAGC